jgi:hypothetical protein
MMRSDFSMNRDIIPPSPHPPIRVVDIATAAAKHTGIPFLADLVALGEERVPITFIRSVKGTFIRSVEGSNIGSPSRTGIVPVCSGDEQALRAEGQDQAAAGSSTRSWPIG